MSKTLLRLTLSAALTAVLYSGAVAAKIPTVSGLGQSWVTAPEVGPGADLHVSLLGPDSIKYAPTSSNAPIEPVRLNKHLQATARLNTNATLLLHACKDDPYKCSTHVVQQSSATHSSTALLSSVVTKCTDPYTCSTHAQ